MEKISPHPNKSNLLKHGGNTEMNNDKEQLVIAIEKLTSKIIDEVEELLPDNSVNEVFSVVITSFGCVLASMISIQELEIKDECILWDITKEKLLRSIQELDKSFVERYANEL